MINSTQTGRQFLFPAGSTYVKNMDHIEPAIAFAPRPESGAVLPAGLHWAEFHSLKVEIGVTQRWAQLNSKAGEWRRFTGVRIVHPHLTRTIFPQLSTVLRGKRSI
ncbi:hypothetical protein V7S43_000444 [Phytophthora oleae]|uniref:Uncharacterized protein n=1 Tax=Phytophthora oleae TaxID=2107226 RepID=A0ABD3G747_9STRA